MGDRNFGDQQCSEHDERKKFYCNTCRKLVCRDCILMKQNCRDHESVTVKKAAEEKLSKIKQAMKQCDEKKKECQDAIKKTDSALTQLGNDADKAKKSLKQAKIDFLKHVDYVYAKANNTVDQLKNTDESRLHTGQKSTKNMLQKVENASTQGQTLAESGSHYNIVENSKSVLETLQKVNKMTLNEVDVSLVKFPASVSMGELNQAWKQIGGFKVDCEGYPTGIAVTSDGKVAVCDHQDNCVKVLSPSGDLVHTLNGPLGGVGDICITNDDTYLYPLANKSANKHKSNYQVISKFNTVNANKQPSEARAVTVDKNGLMIFGMADKAISIHNPDGTLKCSYTIPYQPTSVAVTSNAEVVVASYGNGSVQLFDYSGNCLHTLDPPDEVTSWNPRYVCCSTTDEVFVLNDGDPKAIYKYIAGRVYMGCVTREVDDPMGIALSCDDQILYVTEWSKKMVKKFQRP